MARFFDRRFGGQSSVNPVTVALEDGAGSVARYSFTARGDGATVQFFDGDTPLGSAIALTEDVEATGPSEALSASGRLSAQVTFATSGYRSGAYVEADIETVSNAELELEPWIPALGAADGDLFASDGAGGVKVVGSATYRADVTPIILGAPNLGLMLGSASLAQVGPAGNKLTAWLMDDSSTETVGGLVVLPNAWATVDISIVWLNTTANAGDVRWQGERMQIADGVTPSDTIDGPTTITAGSQDVVKVSALASGVTVTDDRFFHYAVTRVGAAGVDTLTGDGALIAVLFEKAS